MNVNGYETKTTFWQDFTIAEHFGTAAIRDTYRRAARDWKTNKEYMTELVMVLNWKCWYWYKKNARLCELYNTLYYEADELAYNTLTGDDLKYYIQTTD